MTRTTLVALALLLAASTGARAAVPASPTAPTQPWTHYDWNASSGQGDKARFEITEGGVLHVTAPTPNDARFVRTWPVAPGTLYRLACRVRTQAVGTEGRGAGLSVTGLLEGSDDVRGTSGWRVVEMYGTTGPAQRTLDVTVGVGGYGALNRGEAWFDAVTVEAVRAPPAGAHVVRLEPSPPSPAPGSAPSRPLRSGALLGAFAALGLALTGWGFLLRRRGGAARLDASRPPNLLPVEAAHPGPDRIDAAILTALTLACLAISLWGLGGHVAPETGWQPASTGEAVTIELGRDVDLARVYYYGGIDGAAVAPGRFRLDARTAEGRFVPIASFTKDDVGQWKWVDVAARASAVRLTSDTAGGRLNELAFVAKGSRTALAGLHLGEANASAGDRGSPAHLIDEPRAFAYAPSFRTGFYFDEIYHARTAWEMLNGVEPYETTHPPLGKLFIAAGIRLFGMNPFGWRFAGALFGVALVPLLYLVALKLLRSRFYAFCAAFLLMAEFMRFTQSRVAVIDVYGVFFILLMYYFVLDLFPEGDRSPRRTDASLLFTGLAFGVGAACKWIVLYAGAGVVLLVALRTAADLKKGAFPDGSGALGFLVRRIGVCLVAFGAVPAAIYLLAYVPYLRLPGPGHDLAGVLRLQAHMLDYHRALQATHPFSSPWWAWPLDLRPLWMYQGLGLPEGTVSSIVSFGNPAIWWLTIPAVGGALVLALRRRDPRLAAVLTALAFQYLPWVGIRRLAFIYHFFSAVPFVILCLAAVLQAAERRLPAWRAVTWGYLGLTASLFVVFYPVLSGLEVAEGYVAALRWLPTWNF